MQTFFVSKDDLQWLTTNKPEWLAKHWKSLSKAPYGGGYVICAPDSLVIELKTILPKPEVAEPAANENEAAKFYRARSYNGD